MGTTADAAASAVDSGGGLTLSRTIFTTKGAQVDRARFYIDGFNLYHGALEGTPYRWLNLESLCDRLAPGARVEAIEYFTAEVKPRTANPDTARRQQFYLRALRTLPRVSIVLGKFKENSTRAKRLPDPKCACCGEGGCRCCTANTIPILKVEEKGSDVSLAVALVRDAFQDKFDVAYVVSEDSDLQGAVDVVRALAGRKVVVVTPRNRPSKPLRGDEYRQLRAAALQACQFDRELGDGTGRFTRPQAWD